MFWESERENNIVQFDAPGTSRAVMNLSAPTFVDVQKCNVFTECGIVRQNIFNAKNSRERVFPGVVLELERLPRFQDEIPVRANVNNHSGYFVANALRVLDGSC